MHYHGKSSSRNTQLNYTPDEIHAKVGNLVLSPLPSFKIISCYVEVYLRLNLREHDIDETD